MGRSKQLLNNSTIKSPKPSATPESKNKHLVNGKGTPLRGGSKRPVPVGSDDSDVEVETGAFGGDAGELRMSHKKLKLATEKGMELQKKDLVSEDEEDDDEENDSAEEEEEEDEENGDDDDDESEEEDDDDDSEEEDDDDDCEEEDDDDNEEESSEVEEESNKDNSKLNAEKGKAINNLVGSKAVQKPGSMLNNEKLTENKVSSIPSKVTEGSEPQSSTSGKVLILHGPDNLNNLKEFLSKISPVTSISRMEPAPIMATIANISIFKSRLKSGKLMFHGKELEVIPVERVEDANKGMQPTKTLFVGGIPKSMTIEQLKSQLPNNCQPVSLNLLNKNPKINSAFMSFSSIDVAKQAHQIFSSLTVEGQLFKANFAKDQQPRAGPDGSVRVAVSNWDGHPNQLRKLFPTCLDVQWIQKKRKAFLKFPSLEVRKAAVSQPKFHAGKQLKLALTGGPELKTAIVWGFPADTKESDIRGLFGGVVSVSRDTTTGNQSASMTVEFETAADCNNAISSNATLKGRRVTIFLKDVFVDDCANNQQKHSGPSEKKAKPVEVGVSKVKAAHKVSKAEEVNDADDIEDENDDEEDEGTSEDGDDSDEDDESGDESEEEEDGSEDESDEDVDMVSPKGKEKKQFPGLHDKKTGGFPKADNRSGDQSNFKAQHKFGGDFKRNSFRGRGGRSRGRGGQSPHGRGGQSFRGRGGNRGGWSKRGGSD
ncbi:unnamed protein product [Schistosoma guineensis]|nr:unnamed protein product [Schistosoma guineensis]